MGASFNTFKVPGTLTKSEVKVRFDEAQSQDRHENGHSYSGGIGMANGLVFIGKTFPDIQVAQDWLDENAQKWGPALAVTATDNRLRLWNDTLNPEFDKPVWVIGAVCSS